VNNIASVTSLILLLGMALFLLYFERRHISALEISIIATLSALAGFSRIPFVGIPNVQPTTFLIILSGYVFGPFFGFSVGAMSTLVSNTFLGHGPWTPWQMLAWGIIGILSGVLKSVVSGAPRGILSVFSFLCGFLFGFIMNIWYLLFFGQSATFEALIILCMRSFHLDMMHAVFNLVLTYTVGRDLILSLWRFKKRLSYTVE